jgi:hypothetical protein
MIRIVTAMTLALLPLAASAQTPAQTPPESENGRFTFTPVPEGILRLDSRIGTVSLCSKHNAGWACQVVPDERTALEGEIARLQGENGTLKRDLIARGAPLPGGLKSPPAAAQRERELVLRLPSDAELDRAIGVMETAWRRLLGMVIEMRRELDR